MNIDLAKDLYFREFDAKAELDRRIGVYVALLSAVGGVLGLLGRSAWPGRSFLSCLALIFVAVAAILFFLAIAWAFRAIIGYTYEKLPDASQLLSYWQQLNTYYKTHAQVIGNPQEDFADFLIRHCASAATRNGQNNLTRSARFYSATVLLLWVVVIAALAALCLLLDKFLGPTSVRGSSVRQRPAFRFRPATSPSTSAATA